MRRARAEEILGEWGVRDVTPPSARERARLASEARRNPLAGAPLRRRYGKGTVEPDRYLASAGGPLPHMRRLRAIEDETARVLARLARARAAHRGDPAGWRRHVERLDFGALNELIERHNRFYPIEARLPMDPRSRDYVLVGGRSFRLEPLDTAWVLARFPA
jgi:hypothetical protein